jgi:hypothetical protein
MRFRKAKFLRRQVCVYAAMIQDRATVRADRIFAKGNKNPGHVTWTKLETRARRLLRW